MRTVTLFGCVAVLLVGVSQRASAVAPPEVAPAPRVSSPDSTTKRLLRWVLRLKAETDKDYLNQLGALDAALVIPIPNETTKAILIPDVKKPENKREISEKELKELLDQGVHFVDTRQKAAEGVAMALGLDFKPTSFSTIFSKDFEQQLAQKEKDYRNRLPSEIEQTVFRVTVRAGKVEVIVAEQLVKKP
jgi:hypothetical protein